LHTVEPIPGGGAPAGDIQVPGEDVQGLVLRDYFMPALTVLVLKVVDADAARSWLSRLAAPADDAHPVITAASPWPVSVDHFLNVGLTADGLRALQLPATTIESFPEEFLAGAAARAERVGDVGENAPEHWIGGLGTTDPHVVLILHGSTRQRVDALATSITTHTGFAAGLTVVSRHDGDAINGTNLTHFGYRDGFAQPSIPGVPGLGLVDPQPATPLGAFVLGHPSQHEGYSYPVPQPAWFGTNGSFLVFRVVRQDVSAFEAFLMSAAAQTGMSVELVAAKLMGRWRNGVPLALSPDSDTPAVPIGADQMNNFDYADDPLGLRCPIGAHIRRVNPRATRVAGGGGHLHRIARRGLPYGPAWDPAVGEDGRERGIVNLFVNVSILDQFEFVMKVWVVDDKFAAGLRGTQCPISGVPDPGAGTFTIPVAGGKKQTLSGFGRFVTTRGAAYCFLPSLTALRSLERLREEAA
jgi:Dyp-type peroxidase family